MFILYIEVINIMIIVGLLFKYKFDESWLYVFCKNGLKILKIGVFLFLVILFVIVIVCFFVIFILINCLLVCF